MAANEAIAQCMSRCGTCSLVCCGKCLYPKFIAGAVQCWLCRR
jgi:hypothetical protein